MKAPLAWALRCLAGKPAEAPPVFLNGDRAVYYAEIVDVSTNHSDQYVELRLVEELERPYRLRLRATMRVPMGQPEAPRLQRAHGEHATVTVQFGEPE